MHIVHFTRQKKLIAINTFHIQGVEETLAGVEVVTDCWGRIAIDEPFHTAFNRINELDDWDEKALKPSI